ncbi:hypothetical protein Dimus_003055, partial [Dionaea muscipula]
QTAPPGPKERETRLSDSTKSTPRVSNVVVQHKRKQTLCREDSERERDRRAEVRRRRTEKIASTEGSREREENKMGLGQQRRGREVCTNWAKYQRSGSGRLNQRWRSIGPDRQVSVRRAQENQGRLHTLDPEVK